jgi:hypothetical protein
MEVLAAPEVPPDGVPGGELEVLEDGELGRHGGLVALPRGCYYPRQREAVA